MEIQLTAKHLKVTPAIRDYVQQKLDKAEKYFDHIVWGQAFLSVEKRAHNAEFVIHAPGHTIRALATAADLYSAVDLASDKIDAQLKKLKERLKSRHKPQPAKTGALELPPPPAGALKLDVIRQPVKPMSAEDAVEEMESLGQTFRLYEDKTAKQIQLVYRGSDDVYRVLQPVRKGR